jgi:hypothetical protein
VAMLMTLSPREFLTVGMSEYATFELGNSK